MFGVSLWVLVIVWLVCGGVAVAVGHARGRDALSSFLWGALLGVIGVIVVAVVDPSAPDGLERLRCPRCDIKQNVPIVGGGPCYQCGTPLGWAADLEAGRG